MNWLGNWVIIYNTNVNNQVPTFTITETNLYIPVVTLSIQDNEKLLPQLKPDFKGKISSKTRIISTKCKLKLFN